MGKDIEKVAVGFTGIEITIAAGKLTGPIGMDFVPSIPQRAVSRSNS